MKCISTAVEARVHYATPGAALRSTCHRMEYLEHAPPPELAPFVTCFWQITGGAGAHRVLPDGAMDVLFAAGDAAARVIGPMTRAIVTPAGGPAWIAGVRFRPGAAMGMLGVAACELRDDAAGARDVWGPAGRMLDDRLAGAPDAAAARALLEAELLARRARAPLPEARLDRAIATLRGARGELPVPAVAARACLGERQLERLFVERVGYGPKLFARVVRLEHAVASIGTIASWGIGAARGRGTIASWEVGAARGRGTIASWASFARACGYADQAHLIREFRALAGVTPAVYASGAAMSEIDNTAAERALTLRA